MDGWRSSATSTYWNLEFPCCPFRLDGFIELTKLKSLRVLDLSNNSIDMPIHQFYHYVLTHIKKITKLEFLCFAGNPIEDKLRDLKVRDNVVFYWISLNSHYSVSCVPYGLPLFSEQLFIISELPRLKYYNYELVTKEDRNKAHKLEAAGVWDDHLLPVKHTGSYCLPALPSF